MSLADQIIDGGPVVAGDAMPFPAAPNGHPIITAAEINALRDELLELQQLRAAAQTWEQFKVWIDHWDDTSSLDHKTCGAELRLSEGDTLAELVRRAGEHTQDCP